MERGGEAEEEPEMEREVAAPAALERNLNMGGDEMRLTTSTEEEEQAKETAGDVVCRNIP